MRKNIYRWSGQTEPNFFIIQRAVKLYFSLLHSENPDLFGAQFMVNFKSDSCLKYVFSMPCDYLYDI